MEAACVLIGLWRRALRVGVLFLVPLQGQGFPGDDPRVPTRYTLLPKSMTVELRNDLEERIVSLYKLIIDFHIQRYSAILSEPDQELHQRYHQL